MSTASRTLIVPVDGSEHASEAARYASRLASALGLPVVLVHAFPASATDLFEKLGAGTEGMTLSHLSGRGFESIRKESADTAFQRAREHMGQGVKVEERLLTGEAAEALPRFVNDQEASHVVMGRRGLGVFREALLGSVSERMIHEVAEPVTVVSSGQNRSAEVGPLVVPVDGSEFAATAVRYAGDLAAALGLDIHLLHASPATAGEIPALESRVLDASAAWPDEAALAEFGRQSGDNAFAAARDVIADTGAKDLYIKEVRRSGHPAQAVNDYLRELECGEIIIGRRGMGRIQTMLLGSVSQRVLRGAAGPVTVIG